MTEAIRTVRSYLAIVRVACLGAFLFVASCSSATDPASATLRVRNAGITPLLDLRVGFERATIDFGDVAAGATTEYRASNGGVYGYSSFRFTHEGAQVEQPVIDFVGEVPLEGRRFTYVLKLMTTIEGEPFITIQSVTRDR